MILIDLDRPIAWKGKFGDTYTFAASKINWTSAEKMDTNTWSCYSRPASRRACGARMTPKITRQEIPACLSVYISCFNPSRSTQSVLKLTRHLFNYQIIHLSHCLLDCTIIPQIIMHFAILLAGAAGLVSAMPVVDTLSQSPRPTAEQLGKRILASVCGGSTGCAARC